MGLMMTAYIVELENGVWLADGDGDPCRTTIKENAKQYEKFSNAKRGLSNARYYKPFANARILSIQASALTA